MNTRPTLPLCDLIMKGGVTSGIVYPRMISRLARDYQFKNIGGTSAGAIAAAACAAAELGRQSGRHPTAFESLDDLHTTLGAGTRRSSRLFALFQPEPALRRHFDLAIDYIGHRSIVRTILQTIRTVVGIAPLVVATLVLWLLATWALGGQHLFDAFVTIGLCLAAALVAGLLVIAIGERIAVDLEGLVGAVAFAAILATGLALLARAPKLPLLLFALYLAIPAALFTVFLITGLAGFGRAFLNGLHDNFFGICSGRTTGDADTPGLTDWLGPYLNELAGLDSSRPLTFDDLWNAPGGTPGERTINLEMVTTALSQYTSYGIPFRDGSGVFYFEPAEWRKLFPADVIDWLAGQPDAGRGAPPGSGKLRLPTGGSLPVIVAVRMSLSFPLLLSAVPLYAFDFTEKNAAGYATIKRIWFSDGGISSNLPLHFFDELLPEHPTFAINLKEAHPCHQIDDDGPCGANGRVYLATKNAAGAGRYWPSPAEGATQGLIGFISSIVNTMLRWRDESLFPYPGYRDRIVQISLRDTEGGMHLAMSDEQIDAMAAAGECAGELLYRRFHPDGGGDGWPNHQRVRLQSVLGNLEKLARAARKAQADAPWREAIDLMQGHHYSHTEANSARQLLAELEQMGEDALRSGADLERAMYRPRPVLKLTPRT